MIKQLKDSRACTPGVEWYASLGPVTPQQAWDACHRGDWMLWYAARTGVPRPVLVLAAAACAELALPYTGRALRPVCEAAIAAARAWARSPSDATRDAAAAAAADARADAAAYAVDISNAAAGARAAYAAAYAAGDAYAVGDVYAYAVDIADAASDAVRAAAYAADDDAAYATFRASADIVRSHIPEVPLAADERRSK